MTKRAQSRTLVFISAVLLATFGSVARADTIPIVTGEQWVKSSDDVKKAYLVGISNVLDVERAYSKNNEMAARFGSGMQGQTLDSVRQRLDRYYAANPTMIQHPVIETLWLKMAVPGLKSQ